MFILILLNRKIDIGTYKPSKLKTQSFLLFSLYLFLNSEIHLQVTKEDAANRCLSVTSLGSNLFLRTIILAFLYLYEYARLHQPDVPNERLMLFFTSMA